MFRGLKEFIFISALLILTGCASSGSVFTDHDPEQSFSEYQTFAWISEQPMIVSGDRGPNPIDARRLMRAIENALREKGFKMNQTVSDSDFAVSFTVGARDKIDVRAQEVVDFYGPHWRWGYDYFGLPHASNFTRTEIITREYSEGNLSIDIYDIERKSPVWHGSASKRLTTKELEGNNAESIQVAVDAILATFPPVSEDE